MREITLDNYSIILKPFSIENTQLFCIFGIEKQLNPEFVKIIAQVEQFIMQITQSIQINKIEIKTEAVDYSFDFKKQLDKICADFLNNN